MSVTLFFDRQRKRSAACEVMRHHPEFMAALSGSAPPTPIKSAAGTRVWKSVQIGTFVSNRALYGALEDADCSIGDTAEEISALQFTLSSIAMKLDLVGLASELGIIHENVALEDIYAQAQKLGFALAAAEVGPQLRLQYFDQPIGDSLEIAMTPIRRAATHPAFLPWPMGRRVALDRRRGKCQTSLYPVFALHLRAPDECCEGAPVIK